ncbi:MAG TPA: YicC/YloC family endoribonuclease, partial [Pyrinomonadaceae bacterium]
MKSMTGYGRGSIVGEDFSVSVDLKTVNNRFLDVHLRLSTELSSLEAAVKRRISSRLSRGRVDVTINFERTSQVAYELNRPLIAGYVNALREIQEEFDIAGELDINVLARVPGALQPARDGISDVMITAIETAVDSGLDELERMRAEEGEALRKEMCERIERIESLVPTIEAAAAGLVDAYRLRLHKRIGELVNRDGQVIELDPARLAQEVAYLSDRSDVSEEMVRLRSHLKQFR